MLKQCRMNARSQILRDIAPPCRRGFTVAQHRVQFRVPLDHCQAQEDQHREHD